MSKMTENLRDLTQRIRGIFGEMSPRDRALLIGLIVCFAVGIFGSSLWWMSSRESALETKIEARKQVLGAIQGMLTSHSSAEIEVLGLQQRLSNHSGSSLASFIERTSKSVQVEDRLTGVTSKQTTRDGDIETSRYSMTLKSLTLEELGDFIFAVETSDYPVRIDTMKIHRSKKDDAIVLSPTFDLSAFSIIEGENGVTP